MRKVLRAWCGTARELHDARSLAVLEQHAAELEKLQRQSHAALLRVYRSSGREQRARAERGQSGCQACAQNEGISRRCLSPGTEGAPTADMEGHGYGHAIVVGEHGVQFCLRCRGAEGERHSAKWKVFTVSHVRVESIFARPKRKYFTLVWKLPVAR